MAVVAKKITEKRLKRYGHLKRRMEEGYVLRRSSSTDKAEASIPGKRRRGRQKTRWKDSCNRYAKCGAKYGGRNAQDKVEDRNPKLFR